MHSGQKRIRGQEPPRGQKPLEVRNHGFQRSGVSGQKPGLVKAGRAQARGPFIRISGPSILTPDLWKLWFLISDPFLTSQQFLTSRRFLTSRKFLTSDPSYIPAGRSLLLNRKALGSTRAPFSSHTAKFPPSYALTPAYRPSFDTA